MAGPDVELDVPALRILQLVECRFLARPLDFHFGIAIAAIVPGVGLFSERIYIIYIVYMYVGRFSSLV